MSPESAQEGHMKTVHDVRHITLLRQGAPWLAAGRNGQGFGGFR